MGAAFVNDYGTLLVTRSFVGVGEAAYASLGPAVLSDCFHESERAKRFTWFYLAIPVGSALGYGLGGIVAQHFGWRAAFLTTAIGPLVMMEAVSTMTEPLGIKTLVSLNPIMVDGTGMCGACRVVVGGETRFACVDGPDFDGHKVDWKIARRRLTMFQAEEKQALAAHHHGGGECRCR